MIHTGSIRVAPLLLVMAATTIGMTEHAAAQHGRTAVREIVRGLTQEANEIRQLGRLALEEPEFASRHTVEIDPGAIAQALTQPQHRDPFIDAYIRWQLTSFEIDVPDLHDRDFKSLITGLPDLIENPRSDVRTIHLFERAAAMERLNDHEFERLRQLSEELDERTVDAESMNRPALQLRAWLRDRHDHQGLTQRAFELAIEQCAATVRGAWPTRAIKTELTQRSNTIGEDESAPLAMRQRLAATLDRMVGAERRFINQVTFMADHSVRVSFSTAAVRLRDAVNWRSRLFGEHRRTEE